MPEDDSVFYGCDDVIYGHNGMYMDAKVALHFLYSGVYGEAFFQAIYRNQHIGHFDFCNTRNFSHGFAQHFS